jgi:Fuc2NAc and GlcNAc transferase
MALSLAIYFIIGIAGASLFALRGRSWGFVDIPSDRSSHQAPIPRGGGIGISLVLFISAVCWHMPLVLWINALVVSLVSLLGDYRDISFRIRLAVQIAAACIISGSLFLKLSVAEVSISSSILLFIFGVLYISATANYYNFMDGINGIAGVTGAIAFFCLGIYGLIDQKETGSISIAFGIAAACLGFLPLNFPKARVFMGDVGSVLLGFLFASLALWQSQSINEFMFLASLIFPIYLDEISTLIIRIRDGDKLINAHRRHIYQILANQAGFSHTRVTIIYGAIQIFIIFVVWSVKGKGIVYIISLLAVLSSIYFVIGLKIRGRWERSKSAA